MSLVTLVALQIGPWAAWLIPCLAITLGLAAGVLAVRALRERARRADTTARTRLSPTDEGRRVRLAGRLIAAGDGVPSFVDGRPVAVSIARGQARPEERRAEALLVETPDGRFPLAGALELRGTRGRGAQVDGLGRCEVLEARIGETVLVEGFVGRVMQESLRDPAARLGLRSDRDGFFEPVRLHVRANDLRREAAVVAGVVLAACLLLVPLPSPLYEGPTGPDDAVMGWLSFHLYGTEREPTSLRELATVARLLSPARDAELASLETGRERRRRATGSALATVDSELGVLVMPALSPLPTRHLAQRVLRGGRAVDPEILATRIRLEQEAFETRERQALMFAKESSYRGFDEVGLAKRQGDEWIGRPPEPPGGYGRVTCGLSHMHARVERDDRAAYVQRQLAML